MNNMSMRIQQDVAIVTATIHHNATQFLINKYKLSKRICHSPTALVLDGWILSIT